MNSNKIQRISVFIYRVSNLINKIHEIYMEKKKSYFAYNKFQN